MFDETEVIQQQEQTDPELEVQVEPEKPKQTAPTPQESFRELRLKAERAERERDELKQQLQAMQQAPSEEDNDIADDNLVEGRHIKKYKKELSVIKKKLEDQERISEQTRLESKLRQRYSDIDSVLTAENIELLKERDPEAADAISRTGDFYTKAMLAYRSIKDIMPTDKKTIEEKVLAEKNAAKPRSLASVSPQQGDSPLSRANAFANGLTEELKEQLRKEMFEARRNM